jgi:hypothetical protein
MNRTNYIFVDYENVQENELDRIANRPVKVWLVLGERHKSLPLKLVKLIQKFPEQIVLIETALNGKNALDFVLACELGAMAQKDATGYFHVLSRDKGFDALIKHLKAKGIHAARHVAFSEITVLMNFEERVNFLKKRFKTKQSGLPKKRKNLEAGIQSLFAKMLSSEEVSEMVNKLIADRVILISETGNVTYSI